MVKKNSRKAAVLLVSLSLVLVGGAAIAAGTQGVGTLLGGETPYQTTRSIVISASDFSGSPTSITKYGTKFDLTGDISVSGDTVTFSPDAKITRDATGNDSGSFFYGVEMTGITATPSAEIFFGDKTRTWYEMVNNKGTGAKRGAYADVATADATPYATIDHTWLNDRNDNNDSSFWYQSPAFTLYSTTDSKGTGTAFSFKTLTLHYTCETDGSTYSTIFAYSSYGNWQVTDTSGNNLAPVMKVGSTLQFKIKTTNTKLQWSDPAYVVTYGDLRTTRTKTLTPDADGVYSLTIASNYGTDTSTGSTYIGVALDQEILGDINDVMGGTSNTTVSDETTIINTAGGYTKSYKIANTTGAYTYPRCLPQGLLGKYAEVKFSMYSDGTHWWELQKLDGTNYDGQSGASWYEISIRYESGSYRLYQNGTTWTATTFASTDNLMNIRMKLGENGTFYMSEVIGVKKATAATTKAYTVIADNAVPATGGTESTDVLPNVAAATKSTNKAYSYGFYTLADVDLTQYTDVLFYIRASTSSYAALSKNSSTIDEELQFNDGSWRAVRLWNNGTNWSLESNNHLVSTDYTISNLNELQFKLNGTYYVSQVFGIAA